ncbi:MAG TPA: hypothetical protein VI138_04910 [Candidatus Dormibacteraeota bacterium]
MPVGIYFWLVAQFGVNVVVEDSWNTTVLMLGRFASGRLSLASLWSPHNGNRILFPYLFFLAIDLPSHYDAVADMYVGAALEALALVLVCWLVRRTTPLRGIWLIPIGLLLLSPVQIENILWDFQLAWPLTLLAMVACLCCLELGLERRLPRCLAVLAAVVASFSLIQGLLVWPAGLIYGWAHGYSRRWLAGWLAIGVLTLIAYAWRLGPTEPTSWSSYSYSHIPQAVRFLLDASGNYAPRFHAVVGAVVLAACGVTIFAVRWQRKWRDRLRTPLALMFLGLAFVLLLTWGRSVLGPEEALSSRYTTFTLLLPVSLYVVGATYCRRAGARSTGTRWWEGRRSSQMLLAGLVVAVGIQFGCSLDYGLVQGSEIRTARTQQAAELAKYQTAPDSALQPLFAPGGAFVKKWAPILARNHWSVFARGTHG